MFSRHALPILGLLTLSCGEVAVRVEPVVYGTDSRDEVFEHASAAHRAVALTAIAMQIDESWLDETDPENVLVTYTRTLGEAQTLCPGERFADQVEPGTCSGTLIDDRHVLTAGHCVAEPSDCDGASVWLFGYAYEATSTLRTLTADDVYRCERVLVYRDDDGGDHAVVELDRAVVGHVPAELSARASVGTALTLIGHPNGLPMKIAGDATVVSAAPPFLFADVDAFSGNSGSGVFDADARLVGILNAGADDYVASGDCNVVNVTDVAATDGERLTDVRVAIDAFCAVLSSPVCAAAPDAGASDAGVTSPPPTGCACSATGARPSLSLVLVLAWCAALARRRFDAPRRE